MSLTNARFLRAFRTAPILGIVAAVLAGSVAGASLPASAAPSDDAAIAIAHADGQHVTTGTWGPESGFVIGTATRRLAVSLPRDVAEDYSSSYLHYALGEQAGSSGSIEVTPGLSRVNIPVDRAFRRQVREAHRRGESMMLSLSSIPLNESADNHTETVFQSAITLGWKTATRDSTVQVDLQDTNASPLPDDAQTSFFNPQIAPHLFSKTLYPAANRSYEITARWGDTIALKAWPGFWTSGPSGNWQGVGLDINAGATWREGATPATLRYGDFSPRIGANGAMLIITLPRDLDPEQWASVTELDLLALLYSGGDFPVVSRYDARHSATVRATITISGPLSPVSTPSAGGATNPSSATGTASATATPHTTPSVRAATQTVVPGDSLTIMGTGFVPSELVDLYVSSDRQLTAQVTADANGTFSTTLPIPATSTPGGQRAEIRGAQSGPIWLSYTIADEVAAQSGLAATGASPWPAILIGISVIAAGAAIVVVTSGMRRTWARS